MKRRDFLKYAMLSSVLAPKICHAIPGVTAQMLNSGGVGGGGGAVNQGLWANWDESTESSLDTDQDGDGTEDTFICFMENTSGGGNETGVGLGLSGADLVLTQAGNVPGASGAPPRRELADTGDEFSGTDGLIAASLANSSGWSWIHKLYVNTRGTYTDIYRSSSPVELFYFNTNSNRLAMRFASNGTNRIDTYTANNLTTGSIVWVAAWFDGTYLRCGFTTSGSGANGQPTKWSDFDSGSRLSTTTTYGYFFRSSWSDRRKIVGRSSSSFLGYTYYFLASSVCLIDNAA